ncbi:universal stress protein [Pseudalkalibacillus berkeleyi]|uniref:Universal stress protein n=1 Tax=Pseudalkalibacillus berkeleyi TaxID=1069813 RepID=A0ABS9H4C6_9BACL|nr:universal stress protein [Pseudalkalibacillus berkeleyi]MCF6138638.1 universal stress protein [Pseudalkalibacillus berkeleyi]
MFTQILLASDGSDHAIRAAEKVSMIVNGNESAKVTVLYVIDGATSKSDVLSQGSKEGIEEKRKQRLHHTEAILQEQGITYDIKVLRGEPGPTIVQYANENPYDLVVIGSRGLNTFQEMVLGSVSHKVAKRVQCPVMIVK